MDIKTVFSIFKNLFLYIRAIKELAMTDLQPLCHFLLKYLEILIVCVWNNTTDISFSK